MKWYGETSATKPNGHASSQLSKAIVDLLFSFSATRLAHWGNLFSWPVAKRQFACVIGQTWIPIRLVFLANTSQRRRYGTTLAEMVLVVELVVQEPLSQRERKGFVSFLFLKLFKTSRAFGFVTAQMRTR
jgi:hypothetical protein